VFGYSMEFCGGSGEMKGQPFRANLCVCEV
jgi:hypothetical protein